MKKFFKDFGMVFVFLLIISVLAGYIGTQIYQLHLEVRSEYILEIKQMAEASGHCTNLVVTRLQGPPRNDIGDVIIVRGEAYAVDNISIEGDLKGVIKPWKDLPSITLSDLNADFKKCSWPRNSVL
jgi:hypothetical protein